jgi:hypothetical protein
MSVKQFSSLNTAPGLGCDGGTADHEYVTADRYCELAVSFFTLQRCDDAERGLRGLLDPLTGHKFVIQESLLLRHQITSED